MGAALCFGSELFQASINRTWLDKLGTVGEFSEIQKCGEVEGLVQVSNMISEPRVNRVALQPIGVSCA